MAGFNTTSNLVTNAVCFTKPCVDFKEQQALLIYAKALELAAAGGTNYVSSLTGTLLQAAADLPAGRGEEELRAASINLAFLKAAAAGATVPATTALKLAVVNCLTCVPSDDLDRALVVLEGELSATTYS